MPKAYKELTALMTRLEKHYKDMQDMEFTIEKGKLYILQTRNGKRTARSAIRIGVEMAEEKLISREEAVLRVSPEQVSPSSLTATFTNYPLFDCSGTPAIAAAATIASTAVYGMYFHRPLSLRMSRVPHS